MFLKILFSKRVIVIKMQAKIKQKKPKGKITMTSDAKINANRSNAEKSMGPTTSTGKAIASQNAFKHGARSQKLVAHETHNYQQMVDALRESYPSNNPLVSLQIERIARIKVQLDRVQLLIDNTFEEADLKTAIDAHLMNLFELDDQQRSKMAESDDLNVIDIEKLTLASTLLASDAIHCLSQEELLNTCPEFCEYLINQANKNKISLELYISQLESGGYSSSDLEIRLSIKLTKLVYGSDTDLINQNSILEIPFERLLTAAKAIIHYPALLKTIDLKIAACKLIENTSLVKGQPNFETLNNLYRYQTSLQKQLSTTMGELLALDAKAHQ